MNAMLLLMTTRLTLSRGLNKLGHETMEVISDQNAYKLEAMLSEAFRRFQAFKLSICYITFQKGKSLESPSVYLYVSELL